MPCLLYYPTSALILSTNHILPHLASSKPFFDKPSSKWIPSKTLIYCLQHVSQLQDLLSGWGLEQSTQSKLAADGRQLWKQRHPLPSWTANLVPVAGKAPRVSLIISNTTGREKLLNYRKILHFFPFDAPLKAPAWPIHTESLLWLQGSVSVTARACSAPAGQ